MIRADEATSPLASFAPASLTTLSITFYRRGNTRAGRCGHIR